MLKIDFNKEYILEDDRVMLRVLQPADDVHLRVFSQNEPMIWKYSWITAAGDEGLKNYLKIIFAEKEKQTQYPFIVFDKVANEYAGCTRYYNISRENESLEIGYTWYGEKFWGTGLNKHCKYLLLQFAFEQAGCERVMFRADNDNKRSVAAMKSIGCTVEGVLRQDSPKRSGGRRDTIVLSILKDEWFDHVKDNLKKKL